MEFSPCNYARNPNIDFKIVSTLYFTKDIHREIIIRLAESNLLLNSEPFMTDYGEVYIIEPDFHLTSCKDYINIYWLNLDYERIKDYNDKIVNLLGVSKYYWEIHERVSGKFLAECRSGVFELDGEISVSNFVARKFSHVMDSLPEEDIDYDLINEFVKKQQTRRLRLEYLKNKDETDEEYDDRINNLFEEWIACKQASVEKNEEDDDDYDDDNDDEEVDDDYDGYISDDYKFYGERIRVLRNKNPKNEDESIEEYEARIDKLGREWLAADNVNDARSVEEEQEDKEIPLKEMGDIDIIKFIEKLGREPRDECDHWKFTYDRYNPCLARLSYGTFNNCTIPSRSMYFGAEFPLIIRGATFTNVDFGLCLFRHVIFMDCAFDNCNFSKSRIIHLTFDSCQVNNTDIKFENVIVNDLDLEDM